MEIHFKERLKIKSEPGLKSVTKDVEKQKAPPIQRKYFKRVEPVKAPTIYSCPCGMEFEYHSEFVSHTKNVHENVKDHHCNECGRSYSSENDLNTHVKRFHMKAKKGPVFCSICGNQYASQGSLRIHVKYHDKPQFICSFQGCTKFFYRKDKFDIHEKMHRNQRDHLCHFCDSSFVSAVHLRRHIALTHEDHKLNCTIRGCHRTFKLKEQVRRHLLTNHRELSKEILDQQLSLVREMKNPF
jgi:hypothetical protein